MKNNLQKTTIGHSAPDIFILQSRIHVYKWQVAILRHAKTMCQNSSENFSMQPVCETSLRQREAILVKEESPSLLWPDLQLFPGPHKQRGEHSERAGQRSDEMRWGGWVSAFFSRLIWTALSLLAGPSLSSSRNDCHTMRGQFQVVLNQSKETFPVLLSRFPQVAMITHSPARSQLSFWIYFLETFSNSTFWSYQS